MGRSNNHGNKSQKTADKKESNETVKLNKDLFVQLVYGVRDVDAYLDFVIKDYYDQSPRGVDLHKSLSNFSEECLKNFKIKTSNTLALPVYKHKNDNFGYEKYKDFFIQPLPSPDKLAEANNEDEASDIQKIVTPRVNEINDEFDNLTSQLENIAKDKEGSDCDFTDDETEIKQELPNEQVKQLRDKVINLVDDLKQLACSGNQSSEIANLKKEKNSLNNEITKLNNEITKLKKDVSSSNSNLSQKQQLLEKEIETSKELRAKITDLELSINQKNEEIGILKEQSGEFRDRSAILNPDVQDALEKAYDLQKDIASAENLAISILPKCKDLDGNVIKLYVGALAKFQEAIAKCKKYNAYEAELRNIAFKGIIMKGSDLYEKMKENIDNKETWISILNTELFRYDVGGAIVMCEDIAIRLAKMFPTVNLPNGKFGELAANIRTKASKLGLKIDSAKPYDSAKNSEGWEAIDFISPHDELGEGQVAEVLHLGVRYGSSQDKTTFISVM